MQPMQGGFRGGFGMPVRGQEASRGRVAEASASGGGTEVASEEIKLSIIDPLIVVLFVGSFSFLLR